MKQNNPLLALSLRTFVFQATRTSCLPAFPISVDRDVATLNVFNT
jgi:hypothetical protein